MHIIVLADEECKQEFLIKKINADTKVTFSENLSAIEDNPEADAVFIFTKFDAEQFLHITDKPVFINWVVETIQQLQLPENFCRFNGWPTFIKKELWELAGANEKHLNVFKELEWKFTCVTDEPGLVAARIIAMIINEAWFAYGEEVSTKEEIDLAMKLGTNYPFGPFEWCKKIGITNIYALLKKLSEKDDRYTVAPAMENEIKNPS